MSRFHQYHKHKLASLELMNKYLEKQEGRCHNCHELFVHCGGRAKLSIPCGDCLSKMGGLICDDCIEKSKQR